MILKKKMQTISTTAKTIEGVNLTVSCKQCTTFNIQTCVLQNNVSVEKISLNKLTKPRMKAEHGPTRSPLRIRSLTKQNDFQFKHEQLTHYFIYSVTTGLGDDLE